MLPVELEILESGCRVKREGWGKFNQDEPQDTLVGVW
jgi:hypothetical protein